MATAAVSYARENQKRFLEELKELLRIPSVSTMDEHKNDVQKAADFVASELKRIGFEHVEVIPSSGHPMVYADWLHASGKPTVLCYAHYDVQPPDPIEEWTTPPFEPTERNQNIYARGAVDDKGQLWMQVKAFESLFRSGNGKLPINVRILFEGEEEVGGEAIAEYIRKHGDKLKADFALVSDTELFAPELPTLCVGLRGLVYTELEAVGAMTDLHSGVYGGAAAVTQASATTAAPGAPTATGTSTEAPQPAPQAVSCSRGWFWPFVKDSGDCPSEADKRNPGQK